MNKIFTVLLIALSLFSCRGVLISDDIIIVHSKHKIARPYYYKYFYKCYQNGYKMRIYSNSEYKPGQPLIIK